MGREGLTSLIAVVKVASERLSKYVDWSSENGHV